MDRQRRAYGATATSMTGSRPSRSIYGVRPDGSYAFDELPADASDWTSNEHAAFWEDKDVPDSWIKFRDIALLLDRQRRRRLSLRHGGNGTGRVLELPQLDVSRRQTRTLSCWPRSTTPTLYRDYMRLGRMDYLYDKVGLYDTLKLVMQGKESADAIAPVHADVLDIEEHMLHFLENHDEQRIASPDFAGDANRGRPAMVVSALLSRSPTMLYFAQDVGEPGDGDAGFGDPTRTTHLRLLGGTLSPALDERRCKFDGGALTAEEA